MIELVMVILIISVLSIVIIANINSTTSQAKIEAARWKLKGDLSYAQSLAVTQQVAHGVIFYPAQDSYSLYRQNTGNIINNPLTGSAFSVNFSVDNYLNGVDLVSTSFGSPTTNQVEFDSLGIPSDSVNPLAADGNIVLSSYGTNITINVTKNTGKID